MASNSQPFNFNITAEIAEQHCAQMNPAEVKQHWDRFKNHLNEIWCDQNEQALNYTLSWIAFILQRPGQKTKVALILKKGTEGGGGGGGGGSQSIVINEM